MPGTYGDWNNRRLHQLMADAEDPVEADPADAAVEPVPVDHPADAAVEPVPVDHPAETPVEAPAEAGVPAVPAAPPAA